MGRLIVETKTEKIMREENGKDGREGESNLLGSLPFINISFFGKAMSDSIVRISTFVLEYQFGDSLEIYFC